MKQAKILTASPLENWRRPPERPHTTCMKTIQRDWIGLSSVLRPRQHSIGYMGDGFYSSKDPTNSIKVLKDLKSNDNCQLLNVGV